MRTKVVTILAMAALLSCHHAGATDFFGFALVKLGQVEAVSQAFGSFTEASPIN